MQRHRAYKIRVPTYPYTFFDKGLAFHIHNIRSGLEFCFSISNDSDGSEAKKGNAAFLFPQHFVPLQ